MKTVYITGLEKIDDWETEYKFSIERIRDGFYRVSLNNEEIVDRVCDRVCYELLTDVLMSQIRMKIAGFAYSKVFLHAEVVCWINRAIVITARSWSGNPR